uniref:Nuclear cap-binding protein subunit 1 n=1 Tax=Anthurium amnicola TaxID=1678845 RepID=A0A1D1Y1B5_9ARAE
MNISGSSWRLLLLRIGDKCPEYGGITEFKEQIDACYGFLSRELEHSKDEILVFLLQCAEQLPHKIPFYGVLVGLINLENEDIAGEMVESAHKNLQDALYSGDCNRIRILMRFVTVLMCSKVIFPGSIVEVFETLLSSAATTVDEEVGNPAWQSRADFYVTCILSCLPWCGAELSEQVPEEIERVMAGIQSYFSIRKRTPEIGFHVFASVEDKVINEKDFLEDLWDRIQDITNNGWKVDSVPRPHLQFEAQLVVGKSHDFAPVCCPEQPTNPPPSIVSFGKEKHVADLKYPRRLRRLNIFPASKVETMQPIDRFIVEEYLLDVLFFFNGCRKECAAYLVGLPVPFRYEFLMAETIFSQLLLLPQAPFKPLYYTLVIIDLCKALPGAFPSVVAGAVRTLFERISDLDMECRSRLILWFSHHLSNFRFVWPWEEWAHVIDLPKWAPQRVFVQEILEREARLSYWERIKQSIDNASSLEELLPPKGGPSFKYSTEDGKERTERHTLSLELSGMVKGRKTAREVASWVEENIIPVHGSRVALEVVIQTLLDIGSKSFTHLTTVLERYGQVIADLCSDQEKQVMLIDEVSLFWKNSTQMTAVAIDRMMAYRLVSNLAIVSWVFSPANIDRFHLSDCPWEILSNAVNKTYNRISDVRKEISSLEKSVISAEESAAMAKNEFEVAESKLEVVNGEPVQAEKPGRLRRLKAYAEKAKEELISLRKSLEAKEALLAQALEENKVLFYSLYKNFASVLMERLQQVFGNGRMHALPSSDIDEVAVDSGGPAKMQVDQDDGKPGNDHVNGERTINGYNVGEQEQWCRSTLGYVKAFSRQYADEIWIHIDKLEIEAFEGAHPLFKRAVYAGLGWLPEL